MEYVAARAEIYPKQSQRRCDTFATFKAHRYGINMPDDNPYPAKIAREIGHDDIRPRKHLIAIKKIANKRGDATFERVAKEGKHPYFPAEFSAHIHRSRVAATDFCDIPFAATGNKQSKIDTADQIAHDRHN